MEVAALWKKLNFKNQHQIGVMEAPEAFSEAINYIKAQGIVDTTVKPAKQYEFVVAFAQMQKDLKRLFDSFREQLAEDAVVWMAYPKKSSKIYQSDINRDADIWQHLGNAGYEAVRQVAIDADWSALRFRKADFIKSMKRDYSRAMSKKGKDRTKN